MELKELRYFRAIAELGTFAKAAAHLRVAQPALSRQIQKLEHDLGVELLLRTSRGVTPTQAGQTLLERTLHLEHEMKEMRREVSGFAKVVTGALRVAVQQPHSILMIPEIVRSYRRQHPEVSLHIIDSYSGDITDGLLSERIDLAIVERPSHEHVDLAITPLWIDNLRLVGPLAAKSSAAFQRGFVSITEVAGLPMIMPCQHHSLRRLVDAAFVRQHLRFEPIFEADGSSMILEMVKAGLGYALMPSCVLQPLVLNGEIAATEVRPAIRRTTSIVTRTSLITDRAVLPFVELVKAAAPELARSERYGPAALYHADVPAALVKERLKTGYEDRDVNGISF